MCVCVCVCFWTFEYTNIDMILKKDHFSVYVVVIKSSVLVQKHSSQSKNTSFYRFVASR